MINWTAEEYKEYLKTGKQPGEKVYKKSKFHAKRVKIDGILFDSQKEAKYYSELKLRLKAGEITGFCLQPRFVVTFGNDSTKATEYVADFIVFFPDGSSEIIDTKGVKTKEFNLKMKSFQEKYPKLSVKIN